MCSAPGGAILPGVELLACVYDPTTDETTLRVMLEPGERVPRVLHVRVDGGDLMARSDGSKIAEVPLTEERVSAGG